MDLVFLGTAEFGLPTLETLWREHRVVRVYTQEPRPAGRGHREQASPIYRWAQSRGIPVRTPSTLKHPSLASEFAVDAAVVVAYGLIVPSFLLEVPRFGFLNVHGSLLPRWRGAAPIQRALLAGDQEIGITIIQMDSGIDSGPILRSIRLPIPPTATAADLHATLAPLGAQTLLDVLKDVADGRHLPIPQIPSGVYAPKIRREEGRLRWSDPAVRIERQVRAFDPWPGVWFHAGGERIKVYQSTVVKVQGSFPPGTLLGLDFTVACGEQALRLERIQRPGRAILAADACLRGLALSPGDRLEDG